MKSDSKDTVRLDNCGEDREPVSLVQVFIEVVAVHPSDLHLLPRACTIDEVPQKNHIF